MKKTILFLIILNGFTFCQAQKPELVIKYAKSITKTDLMSSLTILASDALEGRETGERGQKMAAALISDHFEKLGLQAPISFDDQTSFYQDVPLQNNHVISASLTTKKNSYVNFDKMIYVGGGYRTGSVASVDLVFAGYGTEQSYNGLDVKEKVVLILSEDSHTRSIDMANIAISKGAIAAVMIRKETDALMEEYITTFSKHFTKSIGFQSSLNNDFMGVYYIIPSLLPELMGKNLKQLKLTADSFTSGKQSALEKIKPGKVGLSVDKMVKRFTSENVIGYLEGSDLKNEIVVISAHYDHLGKAGDKIYNGADDDGSGTAAIMSLAKVFAKAKKDGNGPRRSLLFIAFTGEEKGLLGSAYYSDNPVYPLENTVTNLNIDMIGRNAGSGDTGYVCLVGSDKLSTELHVLSEKANKDYTQLKLDYVFNDTNHPKRIYYRSDHWNFAKKGIPVIFYTNLGHEDYHRETDTIEKIAQDAYLKITKLVFHTAWEVANRDKRPKVDVVVE